MPDKPRDNETKEQFMQRCMADSETKEQFMQRCMADSGMVELFRDEDDRKAHILSLWKGENRLAEALSAKQHTLNDRQIVRK